LDLKIIKQGFSYLEREKGRGRQRETGEMIKRLNFWRLKFVFFRRSKVF